jgi:hypothetical protein
VVRDELWSLGDLDAVAQNMASLQLMPANLGIKLGFLHFEKTWRAGLSAVRVPHLFVAAGMRTTGTLNHNGENSIYSFLD